MLKNKLFLADPPVPINRVIADLENMEKSGNLKDTSESQGIGDRIP